jgi:hypothetical protein
MNISRRDINCLSDSNGNGAEIMRLNIVLILNTLHMKKFLLLFLTFVILTKVSGQTSVPNGDLESWISGSFEYPQYYVSTSNLETFYRTHLPFNLLKSTDAYHGSYAVLATTVASATDTTTGYFVNTPNVNGSDWLGGVPYDQVPTGIIGYYKYNVAFGDIAFILAAFSKDGVNIGLYIFPLTGLHDTYTLFNFTFSPALSQTPDSVVFGAASSNVLFGKPVPGSTLLIDSVSFTGVTSQPAMFNGDFEQWQDMTLYRPESWYTDFIGFSRSADAHSGTYAAEMVTHPGSENNQPVAQAGRISTGYYSNSCQCMMGGYPYTDRKDTLVFYYKYTPLAADDSAEVVLNFKKDGNQIGDYSMKLEASASYKYAELPFELGLDPDSVIVQIGSSLWNHKALSYLGSRLTVDDINFKSQLIISGIDQGTERQDALIYPNPTTGKFTVLLPDTKINPAGYIEIYNTAGQKVFNSQINGIKSDFDISGLPQGLYGVKISDGASTAIYKIVKR